MEAEWNIRSGYSATWERLLREVGFEVHHMLFSEPDLQTPIPFFACVK